MATSGVVGSVAQLWRFPVKSMSGEQLEQAELTERGLVGDRAYALIDANTGKVASAKSVRLFPNLLGCRTAFVEPPRSGRELPPVRIVLPNSTSVTSDSSEANRVLSAYFRRDVTLARAAPEETTSPTTPRFSERSPGTTKSKLAPLGSSLAREYTPWWCVPA